MTQKEQLLDYMTRFGSITRLEAFMDLGIANPSARFTDLKHDGFNIKCEKIPFTTRLGKKSSYGKWSLAEAQNEV